MRRSRAPISVLLVEDEVLISNLIADCLTASGFAVHEVTTADEALRYINSGANVDVLFADVNLPEGMNGAELATRAARKAAGDAVVYTSGRFKLPKSRRWCRAPCSWPNRMNRPMSAPC